MVNTEPQEWVAAFIGGILIGLATTLNFATYGRITGNSGILNTLIKFKIKEGLKWKFSFLSGLTSAGYIIYISTDKGRWENDSFTILFFDPIKVAIGNLHTAGFVIGGLLVGMGTKMGNGCTSGHGVCGIPRLSLRSITAVWIFMTTGISLATFRHYVPFLTETQSFGEDFEDVWPIVGGALIGFMLVVFIIIAIVEAIRLRMISQKLEMPISYLVGFIFGTGLVISGMWRRTKIINFLTLYEGWDPSLMFVMGGAIAVNAITFQLIIRKMKSPTFAEELCLPKKKSLDAKVIIGPGLFGLGWGLAGFCPGPAMVDFFLITHIIIWMAAWVIGQLAWELIEHLLSKLHKQPVNNNIK